MKAKTVLLIGAGVGLAALLIKSAHAKKAAPTIVLKEKLCGNYDAYTLPPFGIYIRTDQVGNKALLQHEMTHWQQYQSMGLIPFYLSYALQYLGRGYDAMPLEQQARGNESDYCKANYTDCVRSGQANTVYNPNFRK